jgi:methionyl-tRNA formyltransferase
MKIIFFGSDNFAVAPLKALVSNGHDICLVVTQPDRKKGRGMHLLPSVFKEAAQGLKLKLFQPAVINSDDSIRFLKGFSADLFVVIAYGQKLSPAVLLIPKTIALNVHASLLPKYRGAAPINWAIIKGETKTGNSLMKITPEMDAGAVILEKERDILESDTAVTMEQKLSDDAAVLLIEGLQRIEKGQYDLKDQDKTKVSFAPKLKKTDGLINWEKSAAEINDLVRGCLDWPGAFTYYKGRILKIFSSKAVKDEIAHSFGLPGQVIDTSNNMFTVATGKGFLRIEQLQLEGKNRMSTEEFIRGNKISAGEKLG